MKKVIFSLLLVISVAAMTSCKKTETNTESSTGNKIMGTWKIVSVKGGNSSNDIVQKGDMLCFLDSKGDFGEGNNLLYTDHNYYGDLDWDDSRYCISDSRLLLFIDDYFYDLEIVKLNNTKMVLSGNCFAWDDHNYSSIDLELERLK